jgi:hypothetical protein
VRWALLLFAFLSFSGREAFALTLAEIRTGVRANVQDTATDSTLQAYSDTFMNAIINEGAREIVNATWAVEITTTVTLIAHTTYYALPTNLIKTRKALFTRANGTTSELEETSDIKLYTDNPDYERQSGTPAEYFVRIDPDGLTPLEIAYIPVPTSASTGTVTLSYYATATDMSSDSDVPFNGLLHLVPYHSALVYFATARIKLMEHRAEEGTAYMQLYMAALKSMQDRLNQMPNYQLNFKGAAGVGR